MDPSSLDAPLQPQTPLRGWRTASPRPSLPEVHASIPVPRGRGFWRMLFAFSGPGLMISVGYMDPGNWATDLEGGASFGYTLLSVVLCSSLMAILLQHLAVRLGVATGRDLAQACRDHYSKPAGIALWILCEIAIAACDLAEIIGSAVAIKLLFGMPIWMGVLLTAADVLAILLLQYRGFRFIEAVVGALILTIAGCFAYEIAASHPQWTGVLAGFIPQRSIVTDDHQLYIAVGILGATVMPHNLYLHSSIVQTRRYDRTDEGKALAIRFASIDSTLALSIAFFVNAAILVLAAVFHTTGHQDVSRIQDAYHLLTPVLGASAASTLFAVALLASGQNSTLTGTLAGQVVMEGFLNIRLKPWVRRLITRLVAIVPAAVVAIWKGDEGVDSLLVLSQVVLSFQLSFAVIPLVLFTSQREKMGRFVNPAWLKSLGWATAAIIVALNAYLLVRTVLEQVAPAHSG